MPSPTAEELFAVSGARSGPSNLNSSMLAGTPPAGRICGRPRSSTEQRSAPIPRGICDEPALTPATVTTVPYVHRRDVLVRHEHSQPTPASSGAPPVRAPKRRKVTSNRIPLNDTRVGPFAVAVRFSGVSPTILACAVAV